jgi:hypothetical protein
MRAQRDRLWCGPPTVLGGRTSQAAHAASSQHQGAAAGRRLGACLPRAAANGKRSTVQLVGVWPPLWAGWRGLSCCPVNVSS